MKIAILGAGALGCYYGARLQESGQDVSFIVRSEYGYLKEHGLQVKSLHGNISLPRINVYRDTEEVGPVDLVVVAWKKHGKRRIFQSPSPLMGPDTTVVTLQNGMGNGGNCPHHPGGPYLCGPVLHLRYAGKTGPCQPSGRGNIQFAPFIPTPEGTEKARNSPSCLPMPASKRAPLTPQSKSSGTNSSGTSCLTGFAWLWAASALQNSTKNPENVVRAPHHGRSSTGSQGPRLRPAGRFG